MFERGYQTWSWEFTAGFLDEAITAFCRGIITSAQLFRTHYEVDTAVMMYKVGLSQGLPEEKIIDALRWHAANDPVGSDSPAGGGSTPLFGRKTLSEPPAAPSPGDQR